MNVAEPPRNYEELIRLVHDRFDGMSKSYQAISVYLTQNPNDVAVLSVSAIAERCGIHASSFVRFAQSLGYEGFKELQGLFQKRLSTAAPGFEAPGVVVSYTTDPEIQSSKKFLAEGLQTAAGVPLQCDEGADFMTFRIGLFGLEKWQNVDRTVAQLAEALDHIGLGAAPAKAQPQPATA